MLLPCRKAYDYDWSYALAYSLMMYFRLRINYMSRKIMQCLFNTHQYDIFTEGYNYGADAALDNHLLIVMKDYMQT